ncbi:MAG: ATP-binding protein [Candidatus Diapherotrites archaeon]|nr:ATP-binding protein [Candidatus Diapherotrites archaeon]
MPVSSEIVLQLVKENERARESAIKYPHKRFIFTSLFSPGRSFTGIAGLRGVGKTTALLQRLAENQNSFYVSMDRHTDLSLLEVLGELSSRYGITELLVDEISYAKRWQAALKEIYDTTNYKVVFTSSVALDVVRSKFDLSRRVVVKQMHPFSLREFVQFTKNKRVEQAKPSDIFDENKMRLAARMDPYFEEYTNGGLIPAYLEEKNKQIFSNILERILERDFVFALNYTGEDVLNVKTMLEYISNAGVDDVSYSSIARNVGITKYKAIQYVDALEKAFVLNPVKPVGSNVVKEPKILFVPPFRRVYAKNLDSTAWTGIVREEFFVEGMKMAGYDVHYLKSKRGEKTPDYAVQMNGKKYVFEIGGAKKNRSQLPLHTNALILTYPSNVKGIYKPLVWTGLL